MATTAQLSENSHQGFQGIEATLESFVNQSSAGYCADELAGALHVEVHDTLLQLVRQGRISRQRVSNLYLYTSVSSAVRRLQVLTRNTSQSIPVARYPTGTSKWNPVEHRLFSEISKNWAGEPLTSYEKILKFIRTTNTKTGLKVSAYLDRAPYCTGLTPSADQFRQLNLHEYDILPKWNYTIAPNLT